MYEFLLVVQERTNAADPPIPKGSAVKLRSDGGIELCSENDVFYGVTLGDMLRKGDSGNVCVLGTCKSLAGGLVPSGQRVGPYRGKLVVVTDDQKTVAGVAEESAGAAGDAI